MTNPHTEGAPKGLLALARKAKCTRCGETCVDSPAMMGTASVAVSFPAAGKTERVHVCGYCALLLREFLHPELRTSAEYIEYRRRLTDLWEGNR